MIRDGFVGYHDELEKLMVPIDDVCPAPYNYNNGDIEAIKESIEVNGMYRPIYVQKETGDVLVGNHTWMACKELGASRIPVVRLDVDEVRAKKIMYADNKIASLAHPDPGLELVLLREIKEAEGLQGSGITDRDLEVLETLNEIPLDTQEFASWPTLTVQVPPHVMRGYHWMTREADGADWRRLELLLRLAGWNGENE
jgi:hypothetical protein